MKVIVADTYTFYIHNSRNTQFPKRYKGHKIIWNMREALLEIWNGDLEELVIPEEGTPGYDFVEFADKMKEIGQINSVPKFKYYKLNIVKKN